MMMILTLITIRYALTDIHPQIPLCTTTHTAYRYSAAYRVYAYTPQACQPYGWYLPAVSGYPMGCGWVYTHP